MARAAVKAKQQAKAQTAKPTRARGKRRHSSGGNPNQELFFVRLRRHQKWVYATLALVFGLSFVLVGVGSGGNGGLSSLYTGLFGGGGGTSISKAQAELKKDSQKGYRDLATAYETNGNTVLAMSALQSYLALNKKDAASWSELGGLEQSQGSTYAHQYQSAQTAAQNADPSAPFLPGGSLAAAVGPNAAFQGASQKATTGASLLYQKAITAFGQSVTAYRNAVKLKPRSVTALEELATAAENAGNGQLAINSLQRILEVQPSTPLRLQIKAQIKALKRTLPSSSSSGG